VTDPRDQQLAELIASAPLNLVSRGDRERLLSEHIPEARALLPHLPLRAGARWMDLGTGGGLPGLVLAMGAPEIRWTLVDSVGKKVQAVRGFAATLGLNNVEVVQGRAESLGREPGWRGRFDGVVARAVAPLPVLLELARGFLADGGTLAAVKGPAWEEELTAAADALVALRYKAVHTAHIASAVRPTWVVTMRADGPPPRGYPRKVGVPRTDPIGGR
jgi:16S rRNA (guanine527-N7)-methyltransferase